MDALKEHLEDSFRTAAAYEAQKSRVCVNYIKTQTSCTSVRPDSDSQPKETGLVTYLKFAATAKALIKFPKDAAGI